VHVLSRSIKFPRDFSNRRVIRTEVDRVVCRTDDERTPVDGLARLQAAIRDLSDPMMVMRRVVDQALVLIASADGAVVELAEDGHLTYVCGAGTMAEHIGTRLRADGSLSGLAVRSGETLHCEDAEADGRVDGQACRRVGAVSMVCVPLRHGTESIGVLKVSAGQPRAFTGTDVATLARLAEFISTTIAAVSDLSRVTDELLGDAPVGIATSHDRSADVADGLGRLDGGGIGQFVANVLRPGVAADLAVKERVERVLSASAFTMLCQPIVDVRSGETVGAEALARIPGPPQQPPDAWFDDAQQVGLGVKLQLAAVQKALELLEEVPDGAFLAINVGPEAIEAAALATMLGSSDPERIVLELTEHLRIDDYPHLRTILRRIRAQGTRLAIDDTGAGFSSLGHLVNLAPDLIKLDRQFTTGIDLDPVRRAIAAALVTFAADTGARVVAEGIETAGELETVRQLGITYGQGYFISRPGPVAVLASRFPQVACGTDADRRWVSSGHVFG
jgi:EAL domain-containing protein (putative c-di-GMP-specific phosphodiesterase class I)